MKTKTGAERRRFLKEIEEARQAKIQAEYQNEQLKLKITEK